MADENSAIRKNAKPRRNAAASVPAPAPIETQPESGGGFDGATGVVPGVAAEDKKPRAATLNIPLKADGTIDMENMRDSTKEKLTRAMGGAPAIVAGGGFEGKDVAPLYDGLGSIEAWCAVKFFGVPPEYAQVFLYDATEKEALAEPTAKILNKYMPSVGKYKDEAQLVLMMYAIHQNKIMLLNEKLAERAARAAAAETPRPVADISRGAKIVSEEVQ